MRKMTREEIMKLNTGDMVLVKLTKLYYPNPVVEYDGYAKIYVQRSDKCPTPIVFALQDIDWAEYSRADLFDEGYGLVFVNEEYQMEVFIDENWDH
ncbi:MAG TPA: hypothetical protein DGG95_12620 [Cytophagales bacterium]|jgi:hypothetical protein|nr:hypothetical protein [Cytophagales bacterium]